MQTTVQASDTFTTAGNVARSRTARLHRAWDEDASGLPLVGLTEARALRFNLFDDAVFNVTRTRSSHSSAGRPIWFGRIDGHPRSEVRFVVADNQIAGTVSTGKKAFRFTSDGSGVVTIREVTMQSGLRCTVSAPVLNGPAPKTSAAAHGTKSQHNHLIDALVVYTPAARQAVGGTAQMLLHIDLLEDDTNQGYANSGITQRIRVVHAYEVAYDQGTVQDGTHNIQLHLNRLTHRSDGEMDDVHALRDAFRADMVLLLVEGCGTDDCGAAWHFTEDARLNAPAAFEQWAFAVVNQEEALTLHGFAHELGHPMGSAHARDLDAPGTTPAFPYAWGYRDPGLLGDYRTIMIGKQSPCLTCAPINFWSNPDLTFEGDATQPLGVPIGEPAEADNRTALNNTAGIVADWRKCERTDRVSVSSSGAETNLGGHSNWTSLSGDGRFVAFSSIATNLVPGDTNGSACNPFCQSADVFVHDRATRITERVSVNSAGGQTNIGGHSTHPSISGDGRFVVFESTATNLVAGDTNGVKDVFVHDRMTGETERVSVTSAGGQAMGGRNAVVPGPRISADGRFVAFSSYATNLVAGDTNDAPDVFVHDRVTRVTERVSVNSAGGQGDRSSDSPAISGDGRFVLFVSGATNLVAGDTNGHYDWFVHDRVTRMTKRVSVNSAGQQGTGAIILNVGSPSLSADGRFAAYWSSATNLVPGDTNGLGDIFVHDRLTGLTERVNVDSAGLQATGETLSYLSISADGRFVAFASIASNLVPGDTNGQYDVFLRDRLTGSTQRISLTSAGAQAVDRLSWRPSLAADGHFVAFESAAPNLAVGDMNGSTDIFVVAECRSRPGPTIAFVTPPPSSATGGSALFLEWRVANFAGPITQNQAHFGITSVLGSSPMQPGTNAVHSHTFVAPNVGAFDSPETYAYIIRALDNGTQILSDPAFTTVSAGPTPPTVAWVTPPPASAGSGTQFTVAWQLTNYVDPAVTNAVGWGVTSIVGQTADQPGGNTTYTATVNVPVVGSPGTIYYTAFAQNPIEFAFAPIVPVAITLP